MTTITLKYPVQDGATTLTEISLRRPKVRDIAAGDKARIADGEMAGTIAMIASMAGLPVPVVMDIDATDFAALAEAMAELVGIDRPLPRGE